MKRQKKNRSFFLNLIDAVAAGEDPAAYVFQALRYPNGKASAGNKRLTGRSRTAGAVSGAGGSSGLRLKMQTRAVKFQKTYRRYQRASSVVKSVIRLAEKVL